MDTVTLYYAKKKSAKFYDYILELKKPKELSSIHGTENQGFYAILEKKTTFKLRLLLMR